MSTSARHLHVVEARACFSTLMLPQIIISLFETAADAATELHSDTVS